MGGPNGFWAVEIKLVVPELGALYPSCMLKKP